jgi:hypothetical protein
MESGVVSGFFPMLGWAIFFGASALSVTLGIILSFHWFRYAMNPSMAMMGTILYGAGCVIILALLLGAVIGLS